MVIQYFSLLSGYTQKFDVVIVIACCIERSVQTFLAFHGVVNNNLTF